LASQKYIYRPPRIQPELPRAEFTIPNPPDLEENANQALIQIALPIITIIGYVLVAVLGSGRSMLMIIPMGLAVVASTGIAIYSFLKEKKIREEKNAAYSKRLGELRHEMENYHEMQRIFFHYNYPDAQHILQVASDLARDPKARQEDIRSGSRLWERRYRDADFGRIRLGIGTLPSTVIYNLSENENYSNPLMRDAVRLSQDSRYVSNIPVTIPLKNPAGVDTSGETVTLARNAIGITGLNSGIIYDFLRTFLIDFAAFHSPADTRIFVFGSHQSRQHWRWAYNLPHCRGNERADMLLFESQSAPVKGQSSSQIRFGLKTLRTLLERRKIRLEDKDGTNDVGHPFILVIVDVLEVVPEWSTLSDLEAESAISTLVLDGLRLGAAVLFLVPDRNQVPSSCQAVIEVEPGENDQAVFRYAETGINTPRYLGEVTLLTNDEPAGQFAHQLEDLSVRSTFGTDLSTNVTLLEMLGISDLEQLRSYALEHWTASKKPDLADWLNASIGLLPGNEARNLIFSAKADGVHGMIAGSTGSGKSELLMTLILGLALNFDPTVLNFVLVDYKGGAAFESFRKLPHCVDIVTNLGASSTARMFASITAELNRRQEINIANGVKDIVHYRKRGLNLKNNSVPYPHLFIIIDEFAEMIAGNAEFKGQLDSITRLGRSLGVDLILAAQKPAGVTDQMRANIKFRVCLRVETPEDSRELLRRSDAAYLPPGIPGRGYLQVGNENIELIQTAYTGGDYFGSQEKVRPNVIWMDRPRKSAKQTGEENPKLHDVVIEMLSDLARDESKPQWRPWPHFLPANFSLETTLDTSYMEEKDIALLRRVKWVDGITVLNEEASDPDCLNPSVGRAFKGDMDWNGIDWKNFGMQPVVGLIDDPYSARQIPLRVNFKAGNAVIFGASGWGKTTFIRSILVSLMVTHTPGELHVYILDFGGRNLTSFLNFPHVGAVITSQEEERVQRLLRKISSIVEERRLVLSQARVDDIYTYNQNHPEKGYPAILVVVDNFAEFKENHENQMQTLISLVRDGRTCGVHFLFSADHPSAISGKLFNLITERMTLKMADSGEYATVVGRGMTDMDNITGRGFVRFGRTPLEFQTALPFLISERDKSNRIDENAKLEILSDSMAEYWKAQKGPLPPGIDILANLVLMDSLERDTVVKAARAYKVTWPLLGIDELELQPYFLDLDKNGPHCLVIGPPNSGKTTLLRTLALSMSMSPNQQAFLVLVDFQKKFFRYSVDGKHSLGDLPACVQVVSNVDDLEMLLMYLRAECREEKLKQKIIVLVDNFDGFCEEADRRNRRILEELAVLGREFGTAGLHFILCGSPAIVSSSDDLRKQVFSSNFGIALRSADSVSRLNGKVTRAMSEIELSAGRGFVVKSGRTLMIQFATPYARDEDAADVMDRWVDKIVADHPGYKAVWPECSRENSEQLQQKNLSDLDWIRNKLFDEGLSEDILMKFSQEDLINMAREKKWL